MGLFKKVKDKKWFQAIQKVAPKIAGALGGPFGGLAENVLEEVLGMNSDQAMEEIAAGNPEIFKQLKDAELEFEMHMKDADIREQDLYLHDVADARARQIATQDKMPAVLTFIAVAAFSGISYMIFTGTGITEGNERFLWLILGSVIGWGNQGFNFHLGSSRGSQKKTDNFMLNGGN